MVSGELTDSERFMVGKVKNVRQLLDKHDAARLAVREAITSGRFLQAFERDPSDIASGVRVVGAQECLLRLLNDDTRNALSSLRYMSANAILDVVGRDHGLSYTELFWELTAEAEGDFNPKIDRLLDACALRWKPGLIDALFTMASVESDALVARALGLGGIQAPPVRAAIESVSSGFLVCGFEWPEQLLVVPWSQVRQQMR